MACHPEKRFWYSHRLKRRWLAACLLYLIFQLYPFLTHAENTFKTLYFLNMSNTLTGIHARDTQLAFQVIMNKIVGTKYPDYRIIVEFPEDIDAARKAIEDRRGHILIINSLDFLDMRRKLTLEPLQILSKTEQPTESYLLLTAAGQDFKVLAKQADRSLVVEKGGSGQVATVWLSTLLLQRGFGPLASFFTTIRSADKPSRAILPVFFGQASACVVAESAFSVMAELNPQIKQKLTILARSSGFVNLIISVTAQLDPLDKQRVFDEAMALNDSVDGQQVLTIIQMKRIFKYEPGDFTATEVLYKKYRQLIDKDG